jgi:hypothetical protein
MFRFLTTVHSKGFHSEQWHSLRKLSNGVSWAHSAKHSLSCKHVKKTFKLANQFVNSFM